MTGNVPASPEDNRSRAEKAHDVLDRAHQALRLLDRHMPGVDHREWIFTMHSHTIREMNHQYSWRLGAMGAWDEGWVDGRLRLMGVEVVRNEDLAPWEFGLIERALWERARSPWGGLVAPARDVWVGVVSRGPS